MIIAGSIELDSNRQLVDALNVFPVPDGDTGTNMSLTSLAASREVEKSNAEDVSEIARLASSGSLRGARGNSGVILSQLYRGFAKALEGKKEANVHDLALALKKASETAYKAVMKPKEGTILTVTRSIADRAVVLSDDIEHIDIFMKELLVYGATVLNQTTQMLPELKQAGVVDAGGKGVLCILEGAYKCLMGKEVSFDEIKIETPKVDFSALTSVENESITFGYCTEFFINVKNVNEKTENDLKNYLETVGDSIVVVSDEDIIKIHVHTDNPGLVIEKALTIGALDNLKIDNMRIQHTNKIEFATEEKKEDKGPKKPLAFISTSMGSGLSELFENLGVDKIIEGGQTMNPSADDFIKAINALHAENIIILPNNKNIVLAANQAAELCADKKIFVIPTKTIPQGLSVMLNYVPQSEFDMDQLIEEMKDSISRVKTGLVTYAVRDTKIDDKEIVQGDILCLLEDKIKIVSKDMQEGTKELISSMVNVESEIISLYYGCDVTKESADEIKAFVNESYPDFEVEVHAGMQPLYYYIISLE